MVSSHKDDDAGFDAGAAYVYVRNNGGTPNVPEDDTWLKEAKLIAGDTTFEDEFGEDVDIQDDTIVVRTWQNDKAGEGAAYVFRRTGTSWTEVAKLTASDAAPSDLFSHNVVIDGDTIVVSAFKDDDLGDDSGSVYVFVEPSGGWSGNLTETAKLTASDGFAGSLFGRNVDVEGNVILVGANEKDVDSGSAYVFNRHDAGTPLDPSDDTWVEQAILKASDAAFGDQFGHTVVIHGSTAIVTAIKDDHSGFVDAGSAYVFERQDNGHLKI